MSFFYPFLNFLQPGILWPELADYKPMLVASLLALFAGLAGSSRTSPRPPVLSKSTTWWIAGFVFVQGLSMYRSGGMAMLDMLGFWYVYPVFVILSVWLIRDEASLRRYIWGMVLGSMFVVIYGIWAKYSGYNSVVHPGELYSMQGRAGAYGMYRNQNDYSFIIVQILPFLYMLRRTEVSWSRRFVLLAAMAACVAGILLCLSRGGMLAVLLEMFLVVVFTMRRRTVAVLLPLLVVVAIGGISYQWKMRAEDQGSSYTYADSKDTRLELWHAARVMIQDNPILGVGSRSFGEHARQYAEISHDDLGKNAHNTYLDVAATSGLMGLVCFLALIGSALNRVRGRPRQPGSPGDRLEAIRVATLIALIAIIFRALMDAKENDWSFYVLAVIAMAVEHLYALRARHVSVQAPGPQAQAGHRSGGMPARRRPVAGLGVGRPGA